MILTTLGQKNQLVGGVQKSGQPFPLRLLKLDIEGAEEERLRLFSGMLVCFFLASGPIRLSLSLL